MTYGRGFGFRGASPAWPYVGRGRGGLPRCLAPGLTPGYTFGAYRAYGGYPFWGQSPYSPQMTQDQELSFLKEESNTLRRHLEEIDARITELESAQD